MAKRVSWTSEEKKEIIKEGWKILLARGDFNHAHRYPLLEVLLTAQKTVFLGKPERIKLNIGKLPNEMAAFRKEFNKLSIQHDRDVHDGTASFIQAPSEKTPEPTELSQLEKASMGIARALSDFQQAQSLELLATVQLLRERDESYTRRLNLLEQQVLELKDKLSSKPKHDDVYVKPKVMIVGLLDSQIAIIKKEYKNKIELSFYTSNTKVQILREAAWKSDTSIVMVDFVSHAVDAAVMESGSGHRLAGGITKLRDHLKLIVKTAESNVNK